MSDAAERMAAAGAVIAELARPDLVAAYERASATVIECLEGAGTLLFLGNGGSAADAAHLAAEFVGRCTRERTPLPALCLADGGATLTALANDYGIEQVFARQVQALGREGDVVVALTTSGRSPNVIEAVRVARSRGLRVIGMTGGDGGELAVLCDVALVAPSAVTARIQECHAVWGHLLAEDVDRRWTGDE